MFDVSASINRVHRVSNGVEEVKQAQPWVRQRKREDGKVEMFVRREGQPDQVVGVVEESGIGRIDDRGRYSGVLSEGQLAELGVDVPPYHGLCRTTIVPAL